MLLVDTDTKSFTRDNVIKHHLAALRPVSKWLKEQVTVASIYACNTVESFSSVGAYSG